MLKLAIKLISFIIFAKLITSISFCDWPKNWQLFFQDPASSIFEGILPTRMFLLIFIAVFVINIIGFLWINYSFNLENKQINFKVWYIWNYTRYTKPLLLILFIISIYLVTSDVTFCDGLPAPTNTEMPSDWEKALKKAREHERYLCEKEQKQLNAYFFAIIYVAALAYYLAHGNPFGK